MMNNDERTPTLDELAAELERLFDRLMAGRETEHHETEGEDDMITLPGIEEIHTAADALPPVPWDGEYQEEDGFNYERVSDLPDGSRVYECGWYADRYCFHMVNTGTIEGWRAYIDDSPSYGERPSGLHVSHRLRDGSRMYVCIRNAVRNSDTLISYCADWSRRTSVYLRTGRTIDGQIEDDVRAQERAAVVEQGVWDGEYQEEDGFNYERMHLFVDGSAEYECGWFGRRFRFELSRSLSVGGGDWRAWVRELPDFGQHSRTNRVIHCRTEGERLCVAVSERVESRDRMLAYASDWARRVAVYIETGRTIDRQIEAEEVRQSRPQPVQQTPVQQAEGFDSESIREIREGQYAYSCSWYGMEFRFTLIRDREERWQARIDRQPGYGSRSADLATTGRMRLMGFNYVGAFEPVYDSHVMAACCAEWARRTAVYIRTGRTLQQQRDDELWDGGHQEANGFNYERVTPLRGDAVRYDCGWFGKRFRFRIERHVRRGWTAYIERQPDYGSRSHMSSVINCQFDEGRPYVVTGETVVSRERMQECAGEWARRIAVYIDTGRTIDRQLAEERAAAREAEPRPEPQPVPRPEPQQQEVQLAPREAEGFDSERLCMINAYLHSYTCSWYGMRFDFSIRMNGAGRWEARIDEQPGYGGRSAEMEPTERRRWLGFNYVNIPEGAYNAREMAERCAVWARRTAVYIRTGRTLQQQRDDELWDGEYQEEDGFNYERVSRLSGGDMWYECGWYGKRFQFRIARNAHSGFRAYIERQPDYGHRGASPHVSHRLFETGNRYGGKHYVCIRKRVEREETAIAYCADWARRTAVYIDTGYTIDEQMTALRLRGRRAPEFPADVNWDGLREDDDGFNFERITRQAERTVYECGWYRKYFRFSVEHTDDGWRAFIEAQPSYGRRRSEYAVTARRQQNDRARIEAPAAADAEEAMLHAMDWARRTAVYLRTGRTIARQIELGQ